MSYFNLLLNNDLLQVRCEPTSPELPHSFTALEPKHNRFNPLSRLPRHIPRLKILYMKFINIVETQGLHHVLSKLNQKTLSYLALATRKRPRRRCTQVLLPASLTVIQSMRTEMRIRAAGPAIKRVEKTDLANRSVRARLAAR